MSMTGITITPQVSNQTIDCGNYAPGTIWRILCDVFNSTGNSITLAGDDAQMLTAMHLAINKDTSPFAQLAEELVEHGEIRLTTF